MWAYRRYMKARFADNTIRPRWMVAGEWLARHPDPSLATYDDVEAWLRDRGLAASSTRNLLVCLRAFYRWLLREGLVSTDPTLLVDRPRVPQRLPRPTPERDVAALGRTDDVQLRALFLLMALAGLRCVECSRLDWRDVDLAEGTVIVNGKGQRERRLEVCPDVVRALAALRLATSAHGPMFTGRSGRRMRAYRVSQLVNQAMHAAGVPSTAHQLRHRFATTAYRECGDIHVVRELLGHASIATTQVYTAVSNSAAGEISRRLELPAA